MIYLLWQIPSNGNPRLMGIHPDFHQAYASALDIHKTVPNTYAIQDVMIGDYSDHGLYDVNCQIVI